MRFCKLVELVEEGLRGRRQIDAVRTAIARVLGSLQIPFVTKAIDQSARGDFPDFERLGDCPLGGARVARNRCNQVPLGSRQAALLGALIKGHS